MKTKHHNLKSRKEYITARHPKTKKLWVLGHCGGGKYMPIVEVKSQAEARRWVKLQKVADADAARLTSGRLDGSEILD